MAKRAKKRGSHKAPVKATTIGGDSPYATEHREDYEAKDAMRTMSRALEIQGDKGLMGRVRKHAKKESERHARVARLDGKPL
jgi:hypothetical protein